MAKKSSEQGMKVVNKEMDETIKKPFTEDGAILSKGDEKYFNQAAMQGGRINLFIPGLIPGRGRMMCMIFGKKDVLTTTGNLIVPSTAQKHNKREINEWANKDYKLIAWDDEVARELKLKRTVVDKKASKGYKREDVKLDIGDLIFVGQEFIPTLINYREFTYAIIHYMDVIAVEKSEIRVTDEKKESE